MMLVCESNVVLSRGLMYCLGSGHAEVLSRVNQLHLDDTQIDDSQARTTDEASPQIQRSSEALVIIQRPKSRGFLYTHKQQELPHCQAALALPITQCRAWDPASSTRYLRGLRSRAESAQCCNGLPLVVCEPNTPYAERVGHHDPTSHQIRLSDHLIRSSAQNFPH